MADLSVPQGLGGQYGLTHTGGAITTVLTTNVGRLCRITIVTAGTAANIIYDGTQVTGSPVIWTDITNRTVGNQVDLQLPIATGVVISGQAGAAALYVTYNGLGAYGK